MGRSRTVVGGPAGGRSPLTLIIVLFILVETTAIRVLILIKTMK